MVFLRMEVCGAIMGGMQYLFATQRPDYSDLASGRVFYSLPGHPAFPVRLASEIFQRCLSLRRAGGFSGPCRLYDPCCGGGYMAAVLGYLHAEDLGGVTASDVDIKAEEFARRNLGLLRPEGLDRRIEELEDLVRQYGKESHREALASAQAMRKCILAASAGPPFSTHTFSADALDGAALVRNMGTVSVDVVITDVPYGQHSQWAGARAQAATHPLQSLMDALSGVLAPGGLLALVSDKSQKVPRAGWQRCDHFQVGLRKVEILRLMNEP